MADVGGDRVFCHACGGVWLKEADGDLSCPHCSSDFTEIIEIPPDTQPSEPSESRIPSPINPWADHNPWAQQETHESRPLSFQDLLQPPSQDRTGPSPFDLDSMDAGHTRAPGSPSSQRYYFLGLEARHYIQFFPGFGDRYYINFPYSITHIQPHGFDIPSPGSFNTSHPPPSPQSCLVPPSEYLLGSQFIASPDTYPPNTPSQTHSNSTIPPSSPQFSYRTYRSPNGRFTFSSAHVSGGYPRGGTQANPMVPMMIQGIDTMFRHLSDSNDLRGQRGAAEMDPFNSHSPAWPEHDHLDIDDDMHHPSPHQQAYDGPFQRNPPPQSLADLLEIFRQAGPGYSPPRQGRHGARGVAGPNPFAMLSALLSMEPNGDAVYSQEQLDRVISQLVDQNTNGTAPPPASTSAIQNLPKKKVTNEMMGTDGSAECSICMDTVELGTEVTVLPCTHWFHFNCIEAWLIQHNTCPHCRRSIDSVPTSGQGTSEDPVVIQDSPVSQRGFGRRRRSSQMTSRSGHSTNSRSGQTPPSPEQENSSTRRSSRSSHHSRDGARGGITGWVWSRLGGNANRD